MRLSTPGYGLFAQRLPYERAVFKARDSDYSNGSTVPGAPAQTGARFLCPTVSADKARAVISFLNALFLTTAFVEAVVAALIYAVFKREGDASARVWAWGCLLMAAGMVLLTIRTHLPGPVSFGVINFIMLYALSLHGHSFWLLAHPDARLPRWPLALCIAYGLLQWGLSMTPLRIHLSLVAAVSWTAMHVYLFMHLRSLTGSVCNPYFRVFMALLMAGALLWLLRVWAVSSYGIPLSTHPTHINLLSIVSVHLVLIAQQISYLIVRLSDEKRLKEEVDRLHASLQQAWKERQIAIEAREEERLQLLGDLHDSFGTKLASLRLRVEKQGMSDTQIAHSLKEILADLYLFANTLSHDDITLEQALIDLRHRLTSQRRDHLPRLHWHLSLEAMPPLEARTALHVLRVIQEALNNALRHADAQNIVVSVNYAASERRLAVSVRDDGQGMASPVKQGQGLSSMQQRARELGAQIVWLPGHAGTELLLTLNDV